ncbi:NACHT, LRR and PYD domains-containing protein 3-like isoform X3 [Alosa sapidissima]|nr:NACHT, LRR and PYD domains-containing protein 3-like isoform X3 [Alosa sapidissima]
MQSDNSMGYPLNFTKEDHPAEQSNLKERPDSPVPSCVSMKSDGSMGYPLNFTQEDGNTQHNSEERSVSPTFSSASMQSDNSMGYPLNFTKEDHPAEQRHSNLKERPDSPVPSCVSMKSDGSMGYPLNFTQEDGNTQHNLFHKRLHSPTPISMKSDNSMGYPLNLSNDYAQEKHDLQHTKAQLKCMLKKTFQCVFESSTQQNTPTCLNKVYTDLYVTEGRGLEVNQEHEVKQTERSFRRPATQDKAINCSDIFKPLPGQQKPIRTVLTNGIAGIGKTFTVQKFILDWAENEANEDIQLMFLLSFRELNLLTKTLLSLTELLQHFVKDITDIDIFRNFKVMLILDGLDESRIRLDFKSSETCCDVTEETSLDVLLTNLIRGNLLPSALLWITTRPAAASQIPPEFIDRVTEIRGFTDPQKEEYFRKRISDDNMASRTITHLKSSRSLYIMCHIPVFGWIAATVLEKLLSETHTGELPRTLTQLYTHFLITQANVMKEKYTKRKDTDEEIIFKLGKLAFQELEKGNLIFYEEDLRECGINVKVASVYSGVCTQIFREESGLYQGKVFSFVHLTVQEYLAALYAHLSFLNDNMSVFESEQASPSSRGQRVSRLHKQAVDRAMNSQNGHLDLFLRYLMGFSQISNQNLLQSLLPLKWRGMKTDDTVKYIRQKIKDNPLPEKSINLFHCLNELGYQHLIEEVQTYLCSKILPKIKLSSDQWAALVFILLTSENDLDIFDLSQYMGSNEALQMLLPVVKVAKQLLITKCNLTEKSCQMLADVLRSKSSTLQELDLSGSYLQLREVKQLCLALGSEDCKLEKLRLNGCKLNDESCDAVISAFNSNAESLRELDMSGNQLNDSVVKKLSETLRTQKCKLEVLRLRWCGVKQEGFRDLTSALQTNPSHLKELDLSMNTSGDAEVRALCEVLNQPQCRLQVLKLNKCELTHDCCSSLESIMSSESSSLIELHLSDNKIQDSGVKRIAAGLQKAHCKLEVLKLYNCSISVNGCGFLASALKQNSSHLRELYLNWNHPTDTGTNPLKKLLETRPPNLKLEKLDINPPNSVN